MARTRTATPAVARPRRTRRTVTEGSTLLQTAERMVGEIERLVAEIASLREDNEALRTELREAVTMLERASAALGGAVSGRRRGRAARTVPAAAPAVAARGRRTRAAGRGRATPASVTPDVVRGVIGKLGESTAAQIAAEISKLAGVRVNGRAIRFLAEKAGARIETVDGQRRYRL